MFRAVDESSRNWDMKSRFACSGMHYSARDTESAVSVFMGPGLKHAERYLDPCFLLVNSLSLDDLARARLHLTWTSIFPGSILPTYLFFFSFLLSFLRLLSLPCFVSAFDRYTIGDNEWSGKRRGGEREKSVDRRCINIDFIDSCWYRGGRKDRLLGVEMVGIEIGVLRRFRVFQRISRYVGLSAVYRGLHAIATSF